MIGVVVPPMYSAYVEAGVRAQVKQVLGAVRGLEEESNRPGFPRACCRGKPTTPRCAGMRLPR